MIVAAGVLCWRRIAGEPYILVIHRAAHDDYSFPKGKLDPGESVPETAIRELGEETRLRTALGPFLGEVHYKVGSRPKVVHYWTAHVDDGQVKASLKRFAPNHEVDELLWLPFPEARRLLSYAFDRELLDRLQAMLPALDRPTFTLAVLRHAKAVSRADWGKGETTRPLTEHGGRQAAHLAPLLACWGTFDRVVTSPWARCVQTIAPYASAHGLDPVTAETLTESAYAADPAATERFIAGLAREGRSTLVCSHRPVLPAVLSAIGSVLDEEARARLVAQATLAPAQTVIVQIARTDDPERPLELVTTATYTPFDEDAA